MTTRMKRGTLGTCKDCGAEFPKHSPQHIYCAECSNKRHVQRKADWQKRNPSTTPRPEGYRDQKVSAKRQRGIDMSSTSQRSITWMGDGESAIPLLWFIRVAVPFDWNLSKNAIHRMGAFGHVYMRSEARAVRSYLSAMLLNALNESNRQIVQAKLWIDIFVQKPNQKGDAINVIDTVADALKDVCGLDDRWFSIRRLDWEIVKTDPMIYVGIGQDTDVPVQICSYCGRALPFEMFTKRRDLPQGVGRECKDCRLAG